MSKSRAVDAFVNQFGEPPTAVVRSPGRINLIGEHTDYNDGFVLPMAIDRAIWLALRPRGDGRVLVHSEHEPDPVEFQLDSIRFLDAGWAEYVKGMAQMLVHAGLNPQGWEGVMTSDLPIGSGLSSSAALEMAVGYAFSIASVFPFDGRAMARWGQRAENEWVGAKTGIMDQMVSANGRANQALFIDCRTLSIEPVPLPAETVVVVMDTMTRHDHTESGYNERRESCERAARALGVSHLRDLRLDELNAHASSLPDECFRRARHVVSENDRVLASVEAMGAGDAETLGRLMDASHESLRDDFQVTNAELDTMVQVARAQPGCLGARMTGGGFGGCVVALVARDEAEKFVFEASGEYAKRTSLDPEVFVTRATRGTAIV